MNEYLQKCREKIRKNGLKDKISGWSIILVFCFFVVIVFTFGTIYLRGLNPQKVDVQDIVDKFRVNTYEIPYYAAERYLVWYNMRTFFFALDYLLTLLGLIASFFTVFFASKGFQNISEGDDKKQQEYNKSQKIVFLSLFATCFTVASIFIKPDTMAYMSQHAWRQLDNCIMQTVNNDDLSDSEKDNRIIEEIVEMENYMEGFEH